MLTLAAAIMMYISYKYLKKKKQAVYIHHHRYRYMVATNNTEHINKYKKTRCERETKIQSNQTTTKKTYQTNIIKGLGVIYFWGVYMFIA
ncbi:hypothetical protein DERP_006718 [Dermatophagoides pteronyssinus]|uniref:Uncharacterized protein n=1 Tax=Dermatophagoides pteronyssinus TaxID=6956 RepID=A0ABQ8IRS8_DERPT|nr:hypothetical protein DERP_006718 [Dermatophagoides pteronyssinus]